MAVLHLDIVGGKPKSERDEEGWVFSERIARVTGVPGTGYQQHQLALRIFGLPQVGDEHPFIADLFLTRHSPSTIEDKTVEIRLRYERRDEQDSPEYARIDIGTSAHQDETDFRYDDAGNKIGIKVFKKDSSAPRTAEEEQGGVVPILAPKSTIVYRRRELGSPGAKSKEYGGKVNSGTWSLDTTAVAGNWLCTGINGSSVDGGKTYDVVYTFEYDARFWIERAFWIDPKTGKPNPDSAEGDGFLDCTIYESIDFNGLNL